MTLLLGVILLRTEPCISSSLNITLTFPAHSELKCCDRVARDDASLSGLECCMQQNTLGLIIDFTVQTVQRVNTAFI